MAAIWMAVSLGILREKEKECMVLEGGNLTEDYGRTIKVRVIHYNVYSKGIGRTIYTLTTLKGASKNKRVPEDVCYVNNFDNPLKSAGTGSGLMPTKGIRLSSKG